MDQWFDYYWWLDFGGRNYWPIVTCRTSCNGGVCIFKLEWIVLCATVSDSIYINVKKKERIENNLYYVCLYIYVEIIICFEFTRYKF